MSSCIVIQFDLFLNYTCLCFYYYYLFTNYFRYVSLRDQAEEVTNKGVPLRKDFETEEKQRRAAEREGRRTRRRRARETPGQPKHYEG